MTSKEDTLSAGPGFAVSVVVVADYDVGSDKGWSQVRGVLQALARQDFPEPVEHILIEFAEQGGTLPPDVAGILPSLRVVSGRSDNSYGLKNEVVATARSELVAMIDGDCQPDPDWLRLAVEALRKNANAACVSGRTEYPRATFAGRAMGLLERSYVEAGGAGKSRHICNNAAAFRRATYLAHPLPTEAGVFASIVQADALSKAGYQLIFEPGLRVVHDFDDSFDRDHRLGVGYGAIAARRKNPHLPGAWAARLGYASIPIFLGVRFSKGCSYALRFHDRYGVGWRGLPAVLALAVRGSLRELPGMWRAVRDEPPPVTAFR